MAKMAAVRVGYMKIGQIFYASNEEEDTGPFILVSKPTKFTLDEEDDFESALARRCSDDNFVSFSAKQHVWILNDE